MGKKARRKPNGQLRRTPAVSRAPASIPSHLKQVTRARVRELWLRAEAGEALAGEDAATVRAIQQHPEYRWVFEQGPDGPDEVDGMSPWMHITMHTIVDQQRALLPDVADAILRLQRHGLTEHEAQHRVAEPLSHQLWALFHDGEPFNQEQYLAQIRAL